MEGETYLDRHDAHRDHHRVFYDAVRSRKRPVEDAVFGFRAAGPALLSNVSAFEKRICRWDAQNLQELKIFVNS